MVRPPSGPLPAAGSPHFSAARIGRYNKFVYSFYKWLSAERLQYAEGWYESRRPDAEDVTMGGWQFRRRCPHLNADLTRFGTVEGETLTCQLHGRKFNLATDKRLTSVGHEIRSERAP